jgi:NADH-quinone oxidoreductase subunit J
VLEGSSSAGSAEHRRYCGGGFGREGVRVMQVAFFWLFSALAVGCALGVVLKKNPVVSAVFLMGSMFALACLFLLLDAHFIAVIQVLVYAGAVMVLFGFIIMILNLPQEELPPLTLGVTRAWGVAFGAVALLFLAGKFFPTKEGFMPTPQEFGDVRFIAGPLFKEYALAFELTSLVLLVGVVGAVLLAKRKA